MLMLALILAHKMGHSNELQDNCRVVIFSPMEHPIQHAKIPREKHSFLKNQLKDCVQSNLTGDTIIEEDPQDSFLAKLTWALEVEGCLTNNEGEREIYGWESDRDTDENDN